MTAVIAERPSIGARAGRQMGNLAIRLAVPVALVVVWEVATQTANNLFFPPPSVIATRMIELWFSGPAPLFFTPAVATDILPSLARMLGGWGIAAVIGITIGFLIGSFKKVSWTVEPMLHFLRSVPGPALLPVFMILLGTDWQMRVALIAFGCIWPVILNTIDGVREVDRTQLETARAFALPRRARVFQIILPSASPKIFAGLSVSLAIALVLMVVSELYVATAGIGFQIQRAQQMFALADMWAGILLIAILGLMLNLIFTLVEYRVLRWYRGARRHDD